MKSPAFLILGLALAAGGCSGSSNSASSTQQSAAPEQPAAAQAASPQSSEPVVTPDLPVYPGATKSAIVGNMTMTRCGHKLSIATYDATGDAKDISGWYATRIPGGIRVSMNRAMGAGASISSTEIFDPSGGRIATVTLTSGSHMPGAPLHVSLATVDPPFSPSELQTMQAVMGSDPVAKQKAVAAMTAKCGPNSVPHGN
jgi:hypothetical protein